MAVQDNNLFSVYHLCLWEKIWKPEHERSSARVQDDWGWINVVKYKGKPLMLGGAMMCKTTLPFWFRCYKDFVKLFTFTYQSCLGMRLLTGYKWRIDLVSSVKSVSWMIWCAAEPLCITFHTFPYACIHSYCICLYTSYSQYTAIHIFLIA